MTTKPNSPAAPAKLWGGRFAEKTAASVEAFTASIHYDARLYRHDINGSRAHARMLVRQGMISKEEGDLIQQGLNEIEAEISAGTFVFREELEDIHMNIEKALVEKIGSAGERLHTARSRNDQIALDIRLYLREETRRLNALLMNLQRAFVRLARRYQHTIMPGYTHLQRAQPVLVAHHLLAYVEQFGRDRERLADGLKRINVMPLGSAALAGTGLPIDRDFVARELGFPVISANSMDSVADRDFAIEFLSACTLIQLHLSRLSEELVLWTTEEFSFVRLADSFCTGSSIMPQKKNPDIPELIRGKSGRVTGNLMSLITLVKGLPMTYNRDLQEDKEPIFDTVDTVTRSVAIMAELLANLEFNEERLKRATIGGYMTATDLADYLVKKGIPFRQAHAIVGRTVAHGLSTGKELVEMSLAELKKFSPLIEEDVFSVLSVEGSVNSRTSRGGTAGTMVAAALAKAEEALGLMIGSWRVWLVPALVVLALCGCGRKTLPIPPREAVPEAIRDLNYRQDENRVILTWTYPAQSTAGTQLPGIDVFLVLRAVVPEDEYCAGCPVTFSSALEIEAKSAIVDAKKRQARYTEALLRPGHRYIYKVQTKSGWRLVSDDSNVVSLSWDSPATAPTELLAEPGESRVVLSWQPVTTLVNGEAVSSVPRYQVYRGVDPNLAQPLAELVTGESYTDTGLTNGQTYHYQVRAVVDKNGTRLVGLASSTVAAVPKDLTPPFPPRNLDGVRVAGGLKLSWERNTEKDLAGYRIYRRLPEESKYTLVGEVDREAMTFIAQLPLPSTGCYWAVTAFDKATPANESGFSKELYHEPL